MGNIFLTGPMGAGKSTIGKQLARKLRKTFIDSDHAIEEKTGVDIATIFDIEGEQGFRRRETTMIEELTRLDNVVLATGGGAVLEESNRQHLKSRGMVIYLRTSVEQQILRTQHDRNRPLLRTKNPETRLRELLDIREPLYIEISDIIVDTDRLHSNRVVQQIQKELRKYANEHP